MSLRFASSRSLCVFAVALCLAIPAAAPAQQRPQFRSTVELVQLQVGVDDVRGGFFRGLNAEDFVVRVNGDPRPAVVAYEVDLARERAVGTATVGSGPVGVRSERPAAARRHFLFFFDLAYTNQRAILEARRAAMKFVDDNAHPDDMIGVATSTRYGITLLHPFSSNHQQARAAIGNLGLVDGNDIANGSIDGSDSLGQALSDVAAVSAGAGLFGGDVGGLDALPSMEFREYVGGVSNYAEQLQQFGGMLQAIEGRKHVVLLSAGFDDRTLTGLDLDALAIDGEAIASNPAGSAQSDPEMRFGAAEVREGLTGAIDMFRNADAVIHAIDPSGLRPRSGSRQSLVAMSSGTGGTANWNMNDITVALTQIEEATASYYMIAYRKEASDPATVNVEVTVARTGAKVVSAPARLTPPPAFSDMNEMQRQLQLAEFMNDDVDRANIAFDAQTVAFPGSREDSTVAVMIEVNGMEIDRLAEERGEPTVELELAAFGYDADNTVRSEFRRKVAVDVAAMRERGALIGQNFRYSEVLPMPEGEGKVRILVREAHLGHLSTATRRFFVESPGSDLSIARPLVVARNNSPAPEGEEAPRFDPLNFGGRRVVPIANPFLGSGESILLFVVGYNVPRDPETDEPMAGLVIEFEEAGDNGEIYKVQDLRFVGTAYDDDTKVTQMLLAVTVPRPLRSGPVRIWARMLDRATGGGSQHMTEAYIQG